MVKNLPAVRETQVQSPGREDPLEKEMAIHSSTLAWKIPWIEEPDRLQSMGLQRVGHDWATLLLLLLKWRGSLIYSYFCISERKYEHHLAWPTTSTDRFNWPLSGKIPFLTKGHASLSTLLLLSRHQSCPTLCDPIDSSPIGSSAPGTLQARTLEWVAIFFSKAWKYKVKVKSLSCV